MISEKTVSFCSNAAGGLAVASATIQTITMPSITLPENSKTFTSVCVRAWWTDASTTATTITGRRLDFGLDGGAKTAYTNTQSITNSGESISGYMSWDITSQFTSQWTGTTMTCQVDITITGPATSNVTVQVDITYTYDDTSATQVKTVVVPLSAPTTDIKYNEFNGTYAGDVPALDTFLGESSKTYIGTWPVAVVNATCDGGGGSSSTDQVISLRVGADTTRTFTLEYALQSEYPARLSYAASFATNTAQDWKIWESHNNSGTYVNHPQAWMVVTYTFDAAATVNVTSSVWVPLRVSSPVGSASYPTVAKGDLYIGEASPTSARMAAYVWWQETSHISGMSFRLGTGGGFVSYDRTGAYSGVNCGSKCLMVRNDAAYVLAQGRTAVELQFYATTGGMNAGNVTAWLLCCYTAPLMPDGIGAHTNTVSRLLSDVHKANAANASVSTTTTAGVDGQVAMATLPADFYIAAAGTQSVVIPIGGANVGGWGVQCQQDAGSGWVSQYSDIGCADAEVGPIYAGGPVDASFFKMWAGDPDTSKNDLESARRWRFSNPTVNQAAQSVCFDSTSLVTWHGHTWTVSGTVSGSAGGTVTLKLCLASTGEVLKTTSRVGNGAFSLTWYDATEEVYVDAYEDATHLGRSAPGLAV